MFDMIDRSIYHHLKYYIFYLFSSFLGLSREGRLLFCLLLSQIEWSINIYRMNEWMDRHMSLQVMAFFQCSYGTFRFLPDCFSHPWIQAGWGQRDRCVRVCVCVCVCVCMCVGEGAGREREEETAEFTKAAGRNQICSKGPATYARCGHSDLLWLELRTASS